MPRESRVVCADYPYHVTQRGNYRQNVFEDDEDREVYMNYFMEVSVVMLTQLMV